MTVLSVQLYSLRDAITPETADAVLDKLTAAGANAIEGFAPERFADWLPEALRRHGISSPSIHARIVDNDDLDALFAICKDFGTKTIFLPHYDPSAFASAEQLDILADKLNALVPVAEAAGFRIGYHNHDFEFKHEVNGTTGYEYLVSKLDDKVLLELDTFWAAFGGQDVPALLAKLGDRVTHLHIKDGRLDERADNVAVGTGELDVDSILEAGRDKVWVVEFDSCGTDVVQATVESLQYVAGKQA
ncbi:MAG TPA: sugar phosphate isomerase/epimerase [Propionibacteriaceae bacterium]|nr:sugar phosphate isomerase/epimerase [Propionibacteriaceae bacterium]